MSVDKEGIIRQDIAKGQEEEKKDQAETEEEKEEQVDAHVSDSIEWVQLCDDKGRTYYWNRRTRMTAWKPPPGIRVVWVGARNAEGEVYYWHTDTRDSRFDLPPLPPG